MATPISVQSERFLRLIQAPAVHAKNAATSEVQFVVPMQSLQKTPVDADAVARTVRTNINCNLLGSFAYTYLPAIRSTAPTST
jgi:hypothetical protein